ncbi:MAG TPA: diacylglycerol kinase family protein [Longimicrobiaceae bacterium]
MPLFCNLASGRSRTEDRLRAAVASAGVAADLQPLAPGALAPAIQGAVAAGAPIVAVAGGDGSVATAAQLLAGTPTVLAVFPAGTLNHFARALGIEDHESAACALARRSVAAVDVGEVNGRVFVNGVSFGLYPRMLRLRREWEPRLGRRGAAVLAAMRAIVDFPAGPLWRHDPDDPASRYPLAWVGAGRGSFRMPELQPRELDSGVLELVIVATWSRTRLLRLARRTLQRGLDGLYACAEFPWCTVRYATEFVPPGPLPAALDAGMDGELVRLEPPLHFRSRPRALRVISARAPAAAATL